MKLLRWVVAVALMGIACSTLAVQTSVSATTKNYLMWQIPSVNIPLPVYVYQNGAQEAYIPSASLQVFAGEYTPGATNATYNLYYQSGGAWYGCSIVLVNGAKSQSSTCVGVVIDNPVNQNGAQGNVYSITMAASAWPSIDAPVPAPTPTNYDNRTITFKNNTQYPVIQIGEACSMTCPTSNPTCGNQNNTAPSCQNTPIVATVTKNTPYVVTVGKQGLNSSAFYLSSYCTADSVVACKTPPTVSQCSGAVPTPPTNWVCTGGYFPGQTAYATKIELTILPVINGIPSASNVDVSAVDGYATGVKLYPASPKYCTYTVPPENSNVLGAGHYSAANPLAQLVPSSTTALSSLCAISSQLPTQGAGSWNLAVLSPTNVFAGCMSPCAYATLHVGTNGVTEEMQNQFCCTGDHNTPGSCDVAAGQTGANTSTYNMNIENAPTEFQHVYGFAYGDAGNDYACPPETNFVVEFVSGPG